MRWAGLLAYQQSLEELQSLGYPVVLWERSTISNHRYTGEWRLRFSFTYGDGSESRRDDGRFDSQLPDIRPAWLLEGEEELYGKLWSRNDAECQALIGRLRGDLAGWLTEELDILGAPADAEVAVDWHTWLMLANHVDQRGSRTSLKFEGRTKPHTPYLPIAGRKVRTPTGPLRERAETHHVLGWDDGTPKGRWFNTAPGVHLDEEERHTFETLLAQPGSKLGHDGIVELSRAVARA